MAKTIGGVAAPVLVAALVTCYAAGPAGAQSGRTIRLVVLGDSLSSGLFIGEGRAFPAVLEQSLRARGYDVSVVNAAYASDTAADGYARVDRDVPAGTDAAIVELGANDRLRNVSAATAGGYLAAIVQRLKARGVKVLLAGFRLPADRGGDPYGYAAMYGSVARRSGVAFYPDFYAGLSSNPAYTVLDRAHPSAEGVQRIVAGMLPAVTRLIDDPGRPAASRRR